MTAYVVPFVLYLGLIQIAAAYPDQYGWLYPTVVTLVSVVTIALLRGRHLLGPHLRVIAGVSVGIIGIALWIGLCRLHCEQAIAEYLPDWLQPKRPAFNPWESIDQPLARWAFVAARLAGLAILVPIVEELFWRGFLLRWLTSANWQQQKLDAFGIRSFVVVTLLFALAHPEWLAALVYCTFLNGLLYWKGDLWNCIVAHGVSNLILGIYILSTGSWELW
ncbi:MAG TPA: CAAX prenyl protease-related protein [Gemmataceae bacterium]|nr:CAAX prenyl protease-related protein [Gemmataceae bacterium]